MATPIDTTLAGRQAVVVVRGNCADRLLDDSAWLHASCYAIASLIRTSNASTRFQRTGNGHAHGHARRITSTTANRCANGGHEYRE